MSRTKRRRCLHTALRFKEVDGKWIFAPPGESVTTTHDRNGFTAVIEGQFTDQWRKIN
jgi:hypothetical protein